MTALVGDQLARDQRSLALAFAASVTVHVLLLVFGPGLTDAVTPPEPLTVTLAPEPAPVEEPPRPLPPAPPPPEPKPQPKPKPQPEPPRQVRESPPKPPREPVITRSEPAETAPAVPAPPPAPPEPPPPPVERPPAPAPVVTEPQYRVAYLSNPKPPYPAFSRRRGEEGTVLLNVLVTREGRAAKVELDHSSGFDALDRSALRTVQDWRFVPARRGEDAVEAWVKVPIVFRLSE